MAKRLWNLVSFAATFSLVIAGDTRNVTLDDLDSSISYNGHWSRQDLALAYNGANAFSLEPNATASFIFTGVAVYYMAPLWPYRVSTLITLDSQISTAVDLTSSRNSTTGDLEVEQSSIRWGQSGLSNTEHTVVLSMWADANIVVMDAIIYTVLDEEPLPTPPVPIPTQSSSVTIPHVSPSPSPVSPNPKPMKIFTAAIGVIAIFAILAFLLYHRRRKHKHAVFSYSGGMSPLGQQVTRRHAELSASATSLPISTKLPVTEDLRIKPLKVPKHTRPTSIFRSSTSVYGQGTKSAEMSPLSESRYDRLRHSAEPRSFPSLLSDAPRDPPSYPPSYPGSLPPGGNSTSLSPPRRTNAAR